MPRKLPTACRHPRCPELTVETYCEQHTKDHSRDIRRRDEVSAIRTQTKNQFYRSAAWRSFSAKVRDSQPRCRCGAASHTVDHIRPINDGGSKWDMRNIQVLCETCNARKRQVESLRARGIAADYHPSLLPPYLRGNAGSEDIDG